MLGRKPDAEWNQWLKKTYTPNLSSVGYGYNGVRNHPNAKALVLFVRLCHEEKSESKALKNFSWLYFIRCNMLTKSSDQGPGLGQLSVVF